MKLKLLTLLLALVLTISLVGCGNNTDSNNSDNMISDIKNGIDSVKDKVESGIQSGENLMNEDTKITREKAKEIALNHANLKDNDIKNYKIEIDREDGLLVYDIEFDHNDTEYNYEIDANSGDIREHDKDSIYD